jgi:hypothetical protein
MTFNVFGSLKRPILMVSAALAWVVNRFIEKMHSNVRTKIPIRFVHANLSLFMVRLSLVSRFLEMADDEVTDPLRKAVLPSY